MVPTDNVVAIQKNPLIPTVSSVQITQRILSTFQPFNRSRRPTTDCSADECLASAPHSRNPCRATNPSLIPKCPALAFRRRHLAPSLAHPPAPPPTALLLKLAD